MEIAVLDPSLATDNLGDEVIYQAVEAEIFRLFPGCFPHRIATHERMSLRSYKYLRRAERVFVAGSNLLPPDGGQWRLRKRDLLACRSAIIAGAGWQHDSTVFTRHRDKLLRAFVDSAALHSVRDEAARRNMQALGLRVANTSCPTLWQLTPEACAAIPVKKAPDAVVTVTAYRQKPEADRAFLDAVTKRYRKVWFYSQMADDAPHIEKLGFGHLARVPCSTAAFTHILKNEDVDYIGSRLHGGIRALQCGKRSLVLQVDNRARDIALHVNLPSLPVEDSSGIAAWIETPAPTDIRLPQADIDAWRAQFAG